MEYVAIFGEFFGLRLREGHVKTNFDLNGQGKNMALHTLQSCLIGCEKVS